MARKAMRVKALRRPRFKTQKYHRCPRCGRVRGFLRKFDLCRLCFRKLALSGMIPGVTKASW